MNTKTGTDIINQMIESKIPLSRADFSVDEQNTINALIIHGLINITQNEILKLSPKLKVVK